MLSNKHRSQHNTEIEIGRNLGEFKLISKLSSSSNTTAASSASESSSKVNQSSEAHKASLANGKVQNERVNHDFSDFSMMKDYNMERGVSFSM